MTNSLLDFPLPHFTSHRHPHHRHRHRRGSLRSRALRASEAWASSSWRQKDRRHHPPSSGSSLSWCSGRTWKPVWWRRAAESLDSHRALRSAGSSDRQGPARGARGRGPGPPPLWSTPWPSSSS